MSDKLPVLSGKRVVQILSKANFLVVHQKGSHIKLKKKIDKRELIVVVPNHKEVSRGVLNNILKQADMSREEFIELL